MQMRRRMRMRMRLRIEMQVQVQPAEDRSNISIPTTISNNLGLDCEIRNLVPEQFSNRVPETQTSVRQSLGFYGPKSQLIPFMVDQTATTFSGTPSEHTHVYVCIHMYVCKYVHK